MSKKVGPAAATTKAKQAVRDDCVASAIDVLFQRLDQHISDKFIFPQTVAHAVCRTMAEMVNMVSIAHVQRMETWLVSLEGNAPEEWDKPEEPLIPLIDSWARGVIPVKKPTDISSSLDKSNPQALEENIKQPRQSSIMALSVYQDQAVRRRSSDSSLRGLRGSLRRFSDTTYPFDPSRKVKFQDKGDDDGTKDNGSRRNSSTSATTIGTEATTPDVGSTMPIPIPENAGPKRSSLIKNEKGIKPANPRQSISTKKKT